MKTIFLGQALARFTAYQNAENQPKYARAVTARVAELIDHCAEAGITKLADVELKHIRDWLRKTPKKSHPGAWKARHLAAQTFFNYCVFVELLAPDNNPLAASPRGATLTNKPLLTEFDFHRLLLVIPDNHMGIQDKIACLLLWNGYKLNELNVLAIGDIVRFPVSAKKLAESTLKHRQHLRDASLWVDVLGNPRILHGQKLNKRLQRYAERAELSDPARVSASLLFQSGNYHRLSEMEEE
jgi:site-specific recombinase XerD